ncbi:DUF998 domain-containing protein [Candidatus Bathyarchaeota archaeon]|nr:DUF998 domain-containing protein [Candidatus Bathyarchaeota archaeon]
MTRDASFIRFSGFCGIFSPIIALAGIGIAIASYPEFSWTENALSDLGVIDGLTALAFNYGLIGTGLLAFIFALGMFKNQKGAAGKAGAALLASSTLSLMAIGIFPENIKPIHYYASVAFFTLFPLALMTLCASFMHNAEIRTGLFTLFVAVYAVSVWIIHWTVGFGSGVAIPEALSSAAAALWMVPFAYRMAFTHPRLDQGAFSRMS